MKIDTYKIQNIKRLVNSTVSQFTNFGCVNPEKGEESWQK